MVKMHIQGKEENREIVEDDSLLWSSRESEFRNGSGQPELYVVVTSYGQAVRVHGDLTYI